MIIRNAKLVRMSDAEYFGPEYKDYVSNSRLSLLNPEEGGSVQAFLNGFDNKRYSPSMDVGSAVHAFVLQPQDYYMSEADLPSGKLGLIAKMLLSYGDREIDREDIARVIAEVGYFGTDATKEKIDKVYNAVIPFIAQARREKGKPGSLPIYLDAKQKDAVSKCVRALGRDRKVKEMLSCRDDDSGTSCFNEYAVLADAVFDLNGKECTVKVKCKIDRFIADDNRFIIHDFKTTHKNVQYFEESITQYHYYRQAAFYKMMLETLYKDDGLEFGGFSFIAVSTLDYSVRTVKAGGNMLQKGEEELEELMRMAAITLMNGNMKRNFRVNYSLKSLPISFSARIKLLSYLCFLLQCFRKKDPGFTPGELLKRIRKDKISNNTAGMIERLELWIEEFYEKDMTYPLFGLTKPKEMSDFINAVLDKELPFAADMWDEDLPF